ncbi:hypothetical protein Tco_1233197, partial [Tanacetum coccineum]
MIGRSKKGEENDVEALQVGFIKSSMIFEPNEFRDHLENSSCVLQDTQIESEGLDDDSIVIREEQVKQKKADSVNNGESDEIRAEMYDSKGESFDDGDGTEKGVFRNTSCCNNMDQTPNVSVLVNNNTDNDDL